MEKQALFMSQIVHVHFQTGDHVLKLAQLSFSNYTKFITFIYIFRLNVIKISTYPIWKGLEKSRRKLRLNIHAGYFVIFFFLLFSRIKHITAKQRSHRMERMHTRSQETELQTQCVQEMGLFSEWLSSGCAARVPPAQVWRYLWP